MNCLWLPQNSSLNRRKYYISIAIDILALSYCLHNFILSTTPFHLVSVATTRISTNFWPIDISYRNKMNYFDLLYHLCVLAKDYLGIFIDFCEWIWLSPIGSAAWKEQYGNSMSFGTVSIVPMPTLFFNFWFTKRMVQYSL